MESVDSEKALQKVKKRIRLAQSGLNKVFNYWQKIAAVLLIPLLAYNIYHSIATTPQRAAEQLVWSEIKTPVGLRSQFTLPDGTLVEINGATTLRYPMQFAENERRVELDGEAFFTVKTDENTPFVVDCNAISIQAMGTAFNVQNRESTNKVITSLLEGKVNILKESPMGNVELLTMKPGETVKYCIKTNEMKKQNVGIDKYLAWRDGKLIFRNDALSDVLNRLSQWYNVGFRMEGEIEANYSYTGSFQDEELGQILNYIEMTTPLQFEMVKESGVTMNRRLVEVKAR